MAEDIKKEEEVVEELLEEEAVITSEELDEMIEAVEEEESLLESVMVGDKEYFLFKTGAAQAKQVSDLLNWIGEYGDRLASVLVTDEANPASALGSTWALVAAIGKISSQEALLDLFVVVTGCSDKEADEFFSINTLIDGAQVLLSQEEYAKVLNRFF